MGPGGISPFATPRGGAAAGLEHGEVGARSVAFECEPCVVSGHADTLLSEPGLARDGSTMTLWEHGKRRGASSVCPVVWEEGCREALSYPDSTNELTEKERRLWMACARPCPEREDLTARKDLS